MASSSINFPTLQGPLLKSRFLGQNNIAYRPQKKPFLGTPKQSSVYLKPCAKFDLFEILGGRGLCKGEKGIQQELTRDVTKEASQIAGKEQGNSGSSETSMITSVPENAFEKEMLGLTGGFPGGEKGLKQFIEKNPPPPKKPSVSDSGNVVGLTTTKKPKAPELPLLMPGMFAIVKNSNNPFYMYTGIVQRITDGKAGVLFEGGNWDRLVTFRLDELQRRDKGPPGKNPKSAILEEMLEKKESQ